MLVDEADHGRAHEQWMDEPGPTDVLAFPMDELRPGQVDEEPEEGVLGDIVLCPAVAERQAADGRPRAPRTSSTAADRRTASCTCSATTTPSRRRSAEMFGLQAQLLADAGAPSAADRRLTGRPPMIRLARSRRRARVVVAGLVSRAPRPRSSASPASAPRSCATRAAPARSACWRRSSTTPPRYLNPRCCCGCSAS